MIVKWSHGNKTALPSKLTNGQVYICKDDGTLYVDLDNQRYQVGGSYKGYFPELKVGYADNMNGRREETSAEFMYRPSNGETSIETGLAKITSIQGSSVVWNNLSLKESKQANVHNTYCDIETFTSKKDHIYFLKAKAQEKPIRYYVAYEKSEGGYMAINWSPEQFSQGGIMHATENTTVWFRSEPEDKELEYFLLSGIIIIDLTQMFGAGNEPSTVEEFRAMFPNIDYEYNEGEIRNMTASGIKTVGFNQWDEQWELGRFSTVSGQNYDTVGQIRAKIPFRVLPNTQYFLKSTVNTWVLFYDENLKVLEGVHVSSTVSANASEINSNTIFTTPQGAYYMRFYTIPSYGGIYNNDICINLVHTGYKNGTYEFYWEDTRDLSVIQKYFPNGMRSAGNVCDEIRWNSGAQQWEAVQRVGVVDLGDLGWRYQGVTDNYPYGFMYADIFNKQTGNLNLLCAKYIAEVSYFKKDKTCSGNAGGATVYVIDSSYIDATSFKAAMQGVMLNYELAEPIITPITEDVNFDYKVSDFGTEEALGTFVPFKGSIVYGFNAVDSIRNNSLRIDDIREELSDHLYWDKW